MTFVVLWCLLHYDVCRQLWRLSFIGFVAVSYVANFENITKQYGAILEDFIQCIILSNFREIAKNKTVKYQYHNIMLLDRLAKYHLCFKIKANNASVKLLKCKQFSVRIIILKNNDFIVVGKANSFLSWMWEFVMFQNSWNFFNTFTFWK